MCQAQRVNNQIAHVFTEVTITESIYYELLPVRQFRVPRVAVKACPTSVYRSAATKPDMPSLSSFYTSQPPLPLSQWACFGRGS